MSENDKQNEVKVILLGSIGVGKTCLIMRYKTGKFLDKLPSTRAANYVQIKKIFNNKEYIFNIWDTAGQEKYNSLTQTFAKNAKIIILVYSIVDKDSFTALDKWLELAKNSNGTEGYSLGVAANKSDLYKENIKDIIPDSKGKEYAKKINAIWKSTSAKEDSESIEELMNELMEDYINNIKDLNNNDASYRLDSTVLSKKEKRGCCKGNSNSNSNTANKNRSETYVSNASTVSVKKENEEENEF